jgi:hypothetical protein
MQIERLTPACRRALEWLPADGSWRMDPGVIGAALRSLQLRHRRFVEWEAGEFGPRGGWKWRWRLTEPGKILRQNWIRRRTCDYAMDQISLENDIAIMRALWVLLRGTVTMGSASGIESTLHERIAITQGAVAEIKRHRTPEDASGEPG